MSIFSDYLKSTFYSQSNVYIYVYASACNRSRKRLKNKFLYIVVIFTCIKVRLSLLLIARNCKKLKERSILTLSSDVIVASI